MSANRTNDNGAMGLIPNGRALKNHGDKTPAFKPIAICGMACRLPGGIGSPEQLWRFLLDGGDARTRVPESRFNIAAYHSPVQRPGATITEYGYFLDDNVDLRDLDTSFFSMARNEVARLDPQQRLLLEVARESVDDAGEVGWKGGDIGVYIGTFSQDWYDAFNRESMKYGIYQATATHDFMVSERLSYEMDLHGPSMTIRTACSSALVGLNEACMAIARGDCNSAIVGGSNIIMAPALMATLSEQGVLSPDGSCKTFSAAANGYARGEAIVSFYIKSLESALRDNNPIRAVLTGSAVNFDGKTATLSMPNPVAQEALIRRAYELAGSPGFGKTGYFECHGTGTQVGDVAETSAVAAVFGEHGGVHIGSIKPNVGHSEGASGLTSLLKAVLALEHRIIPPSIKSLPLNAKIPFEDEKLTVANEPQCWPVDRDERISINSFGVGGANAHFIVESAAMHVSPPAAVRSESKSSNDPQLLVLSANTSQSLQKLIQQYGSFLDDTSENFADIAYTLANKRECLSHRSFAVVAKSTFDPNNFVSSHEMSRFVHTVPSIIMVFTGQGAAWPRFGRDLLSTNMTFSHAIKSLDKHLQNLDSSMAPSWSLEEELSKSARTSRVHDPEFSQPLCTAVQIALVDTFVSLGVRPAAVVGHSSGEIAAAYAAGALTAQEAIYVAFYRGAATKIQTQPGGMAAVGLSWEEAQHFLIPGVVRACDNAPKSVTLSGDADKLASVVAAIRESWPNAPLTMLKVSKAYHSQHMESLGAEYQRAMQDSGVIGRNPCLPFFSSVTGKRFEITKDDHLHLGPSYWRANLERPVLFKSAVSDILRCQEMKEKDKIFLELGPHSALAGPLKQILTHHGSKASYVPTLVRQENSVQSLLQAIGRLFTFHVDIDFKVLMPYGTCLSDLPRYPWDHQRKHWYESRVSSDMRHRKHCYHDLLGIKLDETTDIEPVWRNLLHVKHTPWLCDHKVNDNIVFPFAAYVSMASEALRQVSGIEDGVSLRNVSVNTALLLNEESPTELVTTMRRHCFTDTLDSEWWEFCIFSHNGHTWTKHCAGEGRALEHVKTFTDRTQDIGAVPRKVDMLRWNDTLRRKGLNYGPHFTVVEDVRCSTDEAHIARGTMRNNKWGDEASYHVHPIVLDSYFQLLSIAHSNGVAHTYRRLIAASIESLNIFRATDEQLSLSATAVFTEEGLIGHGSCISESSMILEASGVRVSFFEETGGEDESTLPITARCEWVPHVDFKDPKGLIDEIQEIKSTLPVLEDLGKLGITVSSLVSGKLKAGSDHLAKYQRWLGQESNPDFQNLTADSLLHQMDSLVRSLAGTSAEHVGKSIVEVSNMIEPLIKGEKTGFEILNRDGNFDSIMAFLREYDGSRYLNCLAHSQPNLRVLEIDAGLGDRTTDILRSLKRPDGQILYSQYVYADMSSGILNTAKERFRGSPNLEFTLLDVAQDMADQGFEGRQFDLIIASSILYSTPDVQQTLRNIRGLLAPEGRLLLQEPRPGLKWVKFVLGSLSSWWSHQRDGRMEGPFLQTPKLQEELESAGFDDVNVVASDFSSESVVGSIIIARTQHREVSSRKRLTILCGENRSELTLVAQQLDDHGIEVDICSLGDVPPRGQDVLALIDQDGPFFDNIDTAKFAQFKNFIHRLDGSGVFWVTRFCNIDSPDPRYAPVVGLARTLRSEMAIDFAVCEMGDLDSTIDSRALIRALSKFQHRRGDGLMGPDYEYAIWNGEIFSCRIFPCSLDEERLVFDASEEATLTITQQGRLDTLRWVTAVAAAPGDDEVEIEVYATGLNFRDVLVAMGIIRRREPAFGYEAAGIVRRVGTNVSKFRVGDRAMLIGVKTFSTVVTASQMLFEALPDGMTFSEGASMPLVFTTAIYSLLEVGRLSKGQSVLIHSGCGGVGLAAIQIAHMVGAEVFTTVSSEEKRKYLMETHKIPGNRIFNSRNTSFMDDLIRETNGKGVDLALNSLSGEQLQSTWKCVAKWGTMIEIGKRDLLQGAKLDMTPFLDNRSYSCVDLDQMSRERPELIEILLRKMVEFHRNGYIKPVRIAQVRCASETEDAFRYMQQGRHIGKIILELRDSAGLSQLGHIDTTKKNGAQLDGAASYLLVGGLGGLGRAISVWMVQHGARNLIFLSRHAGSGHQDREFVQEIESMGCTVQLVCGDVARQEVVASAVDNTLAPLKGIINLSMILRDEMFHNMSHEDWQAVHRPKVQGTWNLHNVTTSRNLDLDIFMLFSSLSGIVGQTGQANYASANTFLDSLVQYRQRMALPCTAIDLGAMDGVGYLAQHQDLLRKMEGTGWRVVQEAELFEVLELTMMPQSTRVQTPNSTVWNQQLAFSSPASCNSFLVGIAPSIPLSNTNSNSGLRRDIRMAVYHNVGQGNRDNKTGSGSDTLRSFLTSAKKNRALLKSAECVKFLALQIGKRLSVLLLRSEDEELNEKMNTADLGLDSLIAVKLQTWWKLNFGVDITMLEMLSLGTLEALGKFAAKKLLELYHK